YLSQLFWNLLRKVSTVLPTLLYRPLFKTRNSFHTVPLNVTRQQLTEELTLFQDFADLDQPHPLELKNLHDWLIVPLQPHLNTTTITIVPHGILHYLPFAALTDGKEYLSDNYALLSLPSASILRYLPDKGKSTTGSLLALGDPTIPGLSPLNHAQKEVETIAKLFQTKALVGKAATETALRSRACNSFRKYSYTSHNLPECVLD
ncbi:MAG: CHAT domain-containing protein, partial [Moorea sp. SIO2B7]|nr:CHAT domain-containing protein [Moorena sp. SIO2B7]